MSEIFEFKVAISRPYGKYKHVATTMNEILGDIFMFEHSSLSSYAKQNK